MTEHPANEFRRADGTAETARKKGLFRRLTLRRADGNVYLNRWGVGHDRIGRVLLHRMDAPDPGVHLHDHPWWFVTIPLWGGYIEQRIPTRDASNYATWAENEDRDRAEARAHLRDLRRDTTYRAPRGVIQTVRPWKPRVMRLDECHRITRLYRRTCWTLVIGGPRRRTWGFYLPSGFMPESVYDATVRPERRDLWSDQNADARPWPGTNPVTQENAHV